MLFIRFPAPTIVPVRARLIFDWKAPEIVLITPATSKKDILRLANELVKVLIAPVKAVKLILFIKVPALTNAPVRAKLILDWKEPAKPIELVKVLNTCLTLTNEPVRVLMAPVKAFKARLFTRLPEFAIVPLNGKLI